MRMNTVVLVILLALLGMVTCLAIAWAQRQRAARIERISRDPFDFIFLEGRRHRERIAPWLDGQVVAQRELDARVQALQATAGPGHRGVALVVRVLAAAVVMLLFVLSVLLNVEIFVALNGGDPGIAAVAKGIGASMLELVLAVVAAHLISHREFRSPAWQAQFWAVLAVLAITVVFVYQYAPARSQQAIGPEVAVAEKVLQQARDAGDQAAISAAIRELEDDRTRLREAEHSDQAQSILFPLGEILAGQLALEGGVALAALARRYSRRRDVEEAKRINNRLDARINRANERALRRLAQQLWAAGRTDLANLINTANDRSGDPSQVLINTVDAPTQPPTTGHDPPTSSSEPTEQFSRTEQGSRTEQARRPDGPAADSDTTIELDALHRNGNGVGDGNARVDPSTEPSPWTPPPSGTGNDTRRWNLAD